MMERYSQAVQRQARQHYGSRAYLLKIPLLAGKLIAVGWPLFLLVVAVFGTAAAIAHRKGA